MSSVYIVKQGESITDVVLNSTGSKLNLDAVLTANGFTDWTPILITGQSVKIPSGLAVDANTKRQLEKYPAVNSVTTDVYAKIDGVFGLMADNWILTTGYWNDDYVWKDNRLWRD